MPTPRYEPEAEISWPQAMQLKDKFSPRNFFPPDNSHLGHNSVTQWLYTPTKKSISHASCGQVIFYHLFPPFLIPFIPLRGVAESLHHKQKGVAFTWCLISQLSSSRGNNLLREWRIGFQQIQDLWETVGEWHHYKRQPENATQILTLSHNFLWEGAC